MSTQDISKHKTKIVATVGPACDTYDKLLALVKAGVNVFRLNFSHGSHEDKLRIIGYIRQINEVESFNVAILADLQGPKLRVGEIANNALPLVPGMILTFVNEKVVGTAERIYVSYADLHKDVKPGQKILLDDGKIETVVKEITAAGEIKAEVTLPGVLSSKKGFNLPDTKVSLPALTPKDVEDLEFIIDHNCDWVALSFVRDAADLQLIRKRLKERNSKIKVISKIEKPEAIANLKEIIWESDGVMIARGDLGVELPVEQIPMIQKDIIRKCIHRAKPVIVATQMMESMIDRTRPNRSEITDVANAVLEGADAVMLSGETATGQFPELVIQTMRKIIGEVEKEEIIYNRNLIPHRHSPTFLSDALCYNACKMAEDLEANALVGMTQSGYTGFMLSSYRPRSPLFVFTKEKTLVNQLSLSWGVRAFYYNEEIGLDNIIKDQISTLKDKGFLKTDDIVVNTGSTPVAEHLPTNTIKVSKVL
ncbi:pyruvate kinase [Chitinophaga sancti]|uniref:Pyruvate kinase n=1 Tax=Chitinophaga sancti TaxID=1004 RepID=A0A1K1QTB3_9BACT|nr:pyruvate kinase [Chitinophaga sancti]WQD61920.1 pyruvate kinase [Chitinophaga sancti]WQG92511.1 pyruvate kinase [Chitinophaga sancti]SFW63186.1 pyruvate kinase [Chitinophaga sancti]